VATEPSAQHQPAVMQRVDGAWIVECPQCADSLSRGPVPTGTGLRTPLPDRRTAEQWADAHRASGPEPGPGPGEAASKTHWSHLVSLHRESFVRWLMGNDPTEDFPDLSDLIKRPLWHRRAACRGMGHAVFVNGRAKRDAAAVRICGRCPVRQECLEHALDSPGLVGVWGGTTEVERKWLLRAQSP
jgi:WhiB family transcriptional regulator, redox-sensing transcriptional regulator